MIHPFLLSINEFTYELPAEKIAAYPLFKRDESKLLILKNGEISEDVFKNLTNHLDRDTVLVFNNSKVIPARLNFKTGKAKPVEVFCLEPSNHVEFPVAMAAQKTVRWNCMVGNLKQWNDESLDLSGNGLTLSAKISYRKEGYTEIDFSWQPEELTFAVILQELGTVPIPPYLKRGSTDIDAVRYQTVYARQPGSVAAPTAGLHFTNRVLDALYEKDVRKLYVTLHVSAGTFMPVKSKIMKQHNMHTEWIEVTAESIMHLLNNLEKKIIAVGTTSLRTIESLYWIGCKIIARPELATEDLEVTQWEPYEGASEPPHVRESLDTLLLWMREKKLEKIVCKTAILIAPPYEFKIASGIITNFHQPQSTLLLLISAMIGEKWKEVYNYALSHDFRFLSYGDSSLLLK